MDSPDQPLCPTPRIDPTPVISDIPESLQHDAILACQLLDQQDPQPLFSTLNKLLQDDQSSWFASFLASLRYLRDPGSEHLAYGISQMISEARNPKHIEWAEDVLASEVLKADIDGFDWEASAYELIQVSKSFSEALGNELTHFMGLICEHALPLPNDPTLAFSSVHAMDMSMYLLMQVELDIVHVGILMESELHAYKQLMKMDLGAIGAGHLNNLSSSIRYLESIFPLYQSAIDRIGVFLMENQSHEQIVQRLDLLHEVTDFRIVYEHNPTDANLDKCIQAVRRFLDTYRSMEFRIRHLRTSHRQRY